MRLSFTNPKTYIVIVAFDHDLTFQLAEFFQYLVTNALCIKQAEYFWVGGYECLTFSIDTKFHNNK